MKRVLIANRGEIAVRIIRTCREMGMETITIFSDVDRASPHVLMASEAYLIGAAPSAESYLNAERILALASSCAADAIHPGYGFLSENSQFATSVREAGLIWIGPPPDSITKLGDKLTARKIAQDAGVPVVPGSDRPLSSPAEADETCKQVGFPVLIKAVGGGGGKGMRIVSNANELPTALERATSEADSAFSDKRVYVEKLLPNPRHVEIQIVADSRGNAIAMTERECSIQRRYQKIIEESPSTCINRTIWREMAECAKKIATGAGYVGVGTVEFLVDEAKRFYFLEMNTRLQVEHPVTEMITGIDLVREQMLLAEGDRLSIQDSNIRARGHAIECRIYAEDGFDNFVPSVGTIVSLDVPDGFGVRFDHGIRAGQEITPFYDPLLGKLVVWGRDRSRAIRRMKRALGECHIAGINTTIPFCLAVLSHPRFQSGNYSTGFVGDELDSLRSDNSRNRSIHREIASVLAAVHASEVSVRQVQNGAAKLGRSRWKMAGRKDALR